MAPAASFEPSFFAKLKQKFSCCRKSENAVHPSSCEPDMKARQVQELREFFRELGIYLLMLFCFSLSIWLDSPSVQQFNLAQIFMSAVRPEVAPTSIAAFFDMLYTQNNATGGCSGILCTLTSPDYFAADYNVFADANQSAGAQTYMGSIILGDIRLRQIRVQRQDCSSFYQKLEPINCYPDYSFGSEETAFTKEWAADFDTSVDAAFKWLSAADTGEVRSTAGECAECARFANILAAGVSDPGGRCHLPRCPASADASFSAPSRYHFTALAHSRALQQHLASSPTYRKIPRKLLYV
jgi:hypothetical protein